MSFQLHPWCSELGLSVFSQILYTVWVDECRVGDTSDRDEAEQSKRVWEICPTGCSNQAKEEDKQESRDTGDTGIHYQQ